jgi:transposase
MEQLYTTCAGLDVHKQTVVACVLRPPAAGHARKEVRTFATTTNALLALADWLHTAGCTHVAMESTGSYWKPVYNILEGGCTLLLVNAQHIKKVPGRKTDVSDSEWLADLLQHGLLQPSFVPDRAQRELRDLTRTRTTLIDERAAVVNRLQAVLEDANIKIAGVATDIMGASGRDMLAALLEGTATAAEMANLARGRMRSKRAVLEEALQGRLSDHHRLLLLLHLEHADYLEEQIARLSAEIAARLRPYEEEIATLDTIPGIGRHLAEVIIAEIGTDMGRFPSAAHLASWAGMCPGNYESAGKRRKGTTRRGNKAVRRALTEAAQAAARNKKTYLAAQWRRLVMRRGKKKAAVAVGHTILRIVYHVLSRREPYHELGATYLDERQRTRTQQRAIAQLQALGFAVTLTPKQPAA